MFLMRALLGFCRNVDKPPQSLINSKVDNRIRILGYFRLIQKKSNPSLVKSLYNNRILLGAPSHCDCSLVKMESAQILRWGIGPEKPFLGELEHLSHLFSGSGEKDHARTSVESGPFPFFISNSGTPGRHHSSSMEGGAV